MASVSARTRARQALERKSRLDTLFPTRNVPGRLSEVDVALALEALEYLLVIGLDVGNGEIGVGWALVKRVDLPNGPVTLAMLHHITSVIATGRISGMASGQAAGNVPKEVNLVAIERPASVRARKGAELSNADVAQQRRLLVGEDALSKLTNPAEAA
jgi:hypothetical protein